MISIIRRGTDELTIRTGQVWLDCRVEDLPGIRAAIDRFMQEREFRELANICAKEMAKAFRDALIEEHIEAAKAPSPGKEA